MYKIFYSSLVLLCLCCEELQLSNENPFETPESEQNPEIINWNYNIDGSSVSINWEGNKYALEFSYMLEAQDYNDPYPYLDWSEWIADTNIIINNLDEGWFSFYLKSRIGNKESEENIVIPFEINTIQGCGVRIYPAYQEIQPNLEFSLFVYIEECPDLMLLDLQLNYNQDELEIINTQRFEELNASSGYFDNIDYGEGEITIVAGLLNGSKIQVFNSIGTVGIARINFIAKDNISQANEININESSVFRNVHYQDLGFQRISAFLINKPN